MTRSGVLGEQGRRMHGDQPSLRAVLLIVRRAGNRSEEPKERYMYRVFDICLCSMTRGSTPGCAVVRVTNLLYSMSRARKENRFALNNHEVVDICFLSVQRQIIIISLSSQRVGRKKEKNKSTTKASFN